MYEVKIRKMKQHLVVIFAYQSINQSDRQPINQSINLSTNQSVNNSVNQSDHQSIYDP